MRITCRTTVLLKVAGSPLFDSVRFEQHARTERAFGFGSNNRTNRIPAAAIKHYMKKTKIKTLPLIQARNGLDWLWWNTLRRLRVEFERLSSTNIGATFGVCIENTNVLVYAPPWLRRWGLNIFEISPDTDLMTRSRTLDQNRLPSWTNRQTLLSTILKHTEPLPDNVLLGQLIKIQANRSWWNEKVCLFSRVVFHHL
jgi:hypothetical protein